MYKINKDHFKLVYDKQRDTRYIKLAVDKETENHTEWDSDINCGFMPKMKDSKYCPVTLYLTYIMSLNTASDKIWQQARFCNFPADSKE